MTLASFRPRAGLRAALCLVLFISVSRGQIGAEPVPADKPVNYPDWWFSRAVIPRKNPATTTPSWAGGDYRTSEDYAVLNQGQLKALATAAYDELEANLSGGAGTAIAMLVKGWYNLDVNGNLPAPADRVPKTGVTSAYTAVNLGQLKNVAKPFYDRFIAAGFCPGYPWSYSALPPDDFALVNLGQAKNLFQFTLGASLNEFGLPDWFEAALGTADAVDRARGTNPGGPRDPNSDDDGDGLSNAEEYAAGTRSSGAGSTDSDGDGVPDGLDGWPMNPDLNPPRVAQTRFAVLPLDSTAIPADAQLFNTLGDGCQILYETSTGLYYLWTPGGTKQVLLDGMGELPLSPDGTKVAGIVARTDDDASQGGVWDAGTGATGLLPRVDLNPPAHDSDYWSDYATCVNDSGLAAGRTYQEFTGGVYTLYDSGALWEGGFGERLGRDGGNFNVGKSTFYPTKIGNNALAVGRTMPAGASMFNGSGVIVPGGVFKRLTTTQGLGTTPTLNNLPNPWVIDGDGQLRVNIGGAWKKEGWKAPDPAAPPDQSPAIASWGALGPQKDAEGGVWGINDRCEMIGGFYNGPNGKTGNLVRNAQVFDVNDLIDGYTVAGGLMAINNKGVVLAYVTDNATNLTVPALLLPVKFTLRDSGTFTHSPESSVYDQAVLGSGGNDVLGSRPLGTGRTDSPGVSYNNATEMVAQVINIPGLTWKWSRRVWSRSWQIKKESTWFSYRWGVGLVTTNALKKGDPGEDDTTELYDDNVPGPTTGNIYSTDASGADLRLPSISVGDFVYGEKRFKYVVICSVGGMQSSSVSILLNQKILYTKVANSPDLTLAFRGIQNSVEVGPADLTTEITITKDKVRSIVGDNKDVEFAKEHTNPE